MKNEKEWRMKKNEEWRRMKNEEEEEEEWRMKNEEEEEEEEEEEWRMKNEEEEEWKGMKNVEWSKIQAILFSSLSPPWWGYPMHEVVGVAVGDAIKQHPKVALDLEAETRTDPSIGDEEKGKEVKERKRKE